MSPLREEVMVLQARLDNLERQFALIQRIAADQGATITSLEERVNMPAKNISRKKC